MAHDQFDIKKPKLSKKKATWHLVMIGDHGKVIHLHKYRSIAFLALFLCVISFFSTFGMFYKSNKNRFENRSLMQDLKTSEKLVESLKAEREVLAARLIVAGINPHLETAQKEDIFPETDKVGHDWPDTSDIVSLTDFDVNHDETNNQLNLKFKLTNISHQRATGYLFLVLKNSQTSSSQWLAIPEESLENGMPSDYTSGRRFSILRFKTIKFETQSFEWIDDFFQADILIFGDDGKLILKSEFPIEF